MNAVFVCIEVFAICAIVIALGLLLVGSISKEQKLMCFFMGGSLIQNCGYFFEYLSPTMEAATVAIKMQYLGSVFVPIFYCWFIYCYCHEKAPNIFLLFLTAIDHILLVFIFTFDRHELYYKGLQWLHTEKGHYYLSISYGPLYFVFLICSCLIPFGLAAYVVIRAAITKPQYAKSRGYLRLLALSFLPFIALIVYILKLTKEFDFTPAVLGIVLSLIVILDWNRRLYDVRSLAFGEVINSMGDGVIVLDDQMQLISYNPAAKAIFPVLGEEVIGQNVFEVLKGLPEQILNEKMEFTLNGHFYESHAKQIMDMDESEKNTTEQGCVILILDITETRNSIEEIKRVREQAERANLAKSEFLANMSHEIRTPMNAIVGLSDIIMEESQGRKVYSYASDIKTASRNLLSIINDILDLSKVEAGKMELILTDYYIKEIVGSVVSMMDINASLHGLILKCEYDTSIPCRYLGDEGKIRQMLINLLNNAIKFTKEGYVKLYVGGEAGEDGMENLIFKIEDTGCGIREEDMEKIFEDFKQVDSKKNRTVEGTGLGLAITRHMVILMEGKIDVESVYGQGTTFTLVIPQKIVDERSLQEVPELPQKEQEEDESFTVKGDYHILVVDDNQVNRKVANGFLKRYGVTLSEAESGAQAIEMVKETKYNLIFMDHMMPEMDGIEAVQIIRTECGENGTEPIIIALTANAMDGVKQMFLKNGFQDFLAKPLYRKSVNEMMLKWIPKEQRVHEQTADGAAKSDEAQAGAEMLKIKIPGIDMEMALEHNSGDVEEYKELLKLFCMEGKQKLGLIRQHAESGDYKNYAVLVHGLKSAAANMGAAELSAKAKQHEEAAKAVDQEFVDANYEALLADYETLVQNIQSYLGEGQEQTEQADAPDLKEISREELLSKVKEILELIENFKTKEGAQRIEEILENYRLETEDWLALGSVEETLALYEDDEAEEKMRSLIERLEA